LDIALGMAVDQRGAPRQLTDLGKELAWPLVDDRRDTAEAITLGNGHMAGQYDKHARPRLAGLEQRFAVTIVALLAEPANSRDFWRGQCREGLLKAREGAGEAGGAVRLCSHDGFFRHDQPPYPAKPPGRGYSSTGAREANRLFARAFFAVIAGHLISSRRRRREIGSLPGLRLSPLEIFAQCQF
jgi:hypothetical protein